jgi:hypothetical protein
MIRSLMKAVLNFLAALVRESNSADWVATLLKNWVESNSAD